MYDTDYYLTYQLNINIFNNNRKAVTKRKEWKGSGVKGHFCNSAEVRSK